MREGQERMLADYQRHGAKLQRVRSLDQDCVGSNPVTPIFPSNRIWYRGVMVSHLTANQAYRNVVRVRVTAIPLATTQMTGTSAAP